MSNPWKDGGKTSPVTMVNVEKVTVDKNYFDALLRRADCHNAAQSLTPLDPANVTISRAEYNGLLRVSQEYDLLKNALYQGGVTAETLELLISAPQTADQRIDSAIEPSEQWNRAFNGAPHNATSYSTPHSSFAHPRHYGINNAIGLYGTEPYFTSGGHVDGFQHHQKHGQMASFQRQTSYGMTSALEDVVFDDGDDDIDESGSPAADLNGTTTPQERRTLFFSGLSEKTTYRDLVSVIHGGKVLNIHLRQDRAALVTFVEGAVDFLAWTKRHDIYLHSKRIEVKWADRQYPMNAHIANKVASGASRNLLVKSAVEKGLNEQQIRDDMEHIHNLIVIDVVFRNGDAFISTNSVHNALFARTCMMSRTSYKGCKIQFYRDECDIPAPMRSEMPKLQSSMPAKKKKTSMANRFNMLNLDDLGGSSDEENRTPSDINDSDQEAVEDKDGVGVSLGFLDR